MNERKGISAFGVVCVVLAVLAVVFLVLGAALSGIRSVQELGNTVRSAVETVSEEGASGLLGQLGGWLEDLNDGVTISLDGLLSQVEDVSALTDCSVSESFDPEGLRTIKTEIVLGAVDVVPSEDGQIHITYDCFLSEALAERHKFTAKRTGSTLTLRQKFTQKNIGSLQYRTRLTIALPEEQPCAVEIDSVNGNITVETALSAAELSAVNGSISSTDLPCGTLTAETVNGSIDLIVTAVPQDISLESVNGTIRLGLPAASEFEYDLENVNGALTLSDFVPTDVTEDTKREKRGEVGNSRARVRLSCVNGELEIYANR